MENFLGILEKIQAVVWGPPTMALLIATGLYLTIRLGGIQFKHFGTACKLIFEKEEGQGDVSTFGTLCATLAATIGTGSIVGVATAIRAGGPGALVWMWLSAIVGMATKYAECLLAVKYRKVDQNGQMIGGPMYYIQEGLGKKWIWLAKIFAFFGVVTAIFGSGTFPQVNAITSSTLQTFNLPVLWVGIVITVLSAVVIVGGINSIAKVAEFIVPIMAFLYVGSGIAIMALNAGKIPAAISLIFQSAFNPRAVAGGVSGTVIAAVMSSMRAGIARGIYTNEAGLGSAPIMAAAAQTNSSVKQGLLSMTSVFFTTIVICSMTGIVIVLSGLLDTTALDGGNLSNTAFQVGMPGNFGMYAVTIGLIFFAFTSIIGWCYYGERCIVYLTNSVKSIIPYKIVYITCVALAPYLELKPIWAMADITNGLMAFPNLIALVVLTPIVVKETKLYFEGQTSSGKQVKDAEKVALVE